MKFKLLADESVDFRIVKYLRENEIDIYSILENHPGITDEQVINIAKEKNSILLTEVFPASSRFQSPPTDFSYC